MQLSLPARVQFSLPAWGRLSLPAWVRLSLPGLAAAQVVGILLADRFEPDSGVVWCLAGVLVVVAPLARWPEGRAGLLFAAATAVGAASLAGPLQAGRTGPAVFGSVIFEATVASVAWHGERVSVDWNDVRGVGPTPLPARLRTHDRFDPDIAAELQAPNPGERWRVRARLRRPEGVRNPGAFDRTRGLARRGIAGEGSRSHAGLAVRVGGEGHGASRWLRTWRDARAARLASLGPGGPLLAALGLGERRALSADLREAFARLGLAHLLAVSGLHLALVAGGSFAVARWLLTRAAGFAARRDARRVAMALAIPAAAAYAGLSGWAIPVQRAAVLLAAATLALALRRPRQPATALALAAFVLLARAPHVLFEAGFQLSFVATAGLLYSKPGAERGAAGGLARRLQAAEGLLRASASALLATGPVVAAHFGAGPPVGLLANAVAIPATAVGLLPAAGVAVAAAGFDAVPARAAAWLAERIAAGALAAVSAAAESLPFDPGTGARVASPSVLAVAFGVAIFGVRRFGTGARVAALVVQAAWLVGAPVPSISPHPPRLVVADVGQGDALLVQGRSGVLAIDAGRRLGPSYDQGVRVVAPAWAALGVTRIDRLAVSHADLDHRGGAPALLERFEVGAVWLPAGAADDPAFASLHRTAVRRGVPVLERGQGDAAEWLGDLRVEFLWPPRGLAPARRNDGSLVLRVTPAGGARALLAGDIGGEAERGLLSTPGALATDVLLLPHHGSASSGSAAFLAATRPVLALVSAPCRGRFPLPHADVRARVRDRGIPLAWTGRDGALIVGLAPRMRLRTWGDARSGCRGTTQVGQGLPSFAVFPGESR
ncbi:MAG: DNA internalization-related competence protein ComEC/Rec2 [Deltaproteobacteria bacterium]|nr:DNA internalization-related competence protein ComEC/Rec2 [Deltaproteobacteria bacterium]MBW2445332.1 DNA internalization-related competence protein ComEC/Rec2 [Deltaproteobacteria bacterium]